MKTFHPASHVFGPVASRRLGWSLGVDLVLPKTCTLDCRYCECGFTNQLTLERKEYVSAGEVIRELEQVIPTVGYCDVVTFSGSGEPTLSCSIREVSQTIKSLTNKPLVLLTNGTLLHKDDIMDDLRYIDVMIPSLDAADERTFRAINQPHPALQFSEYIRGLRQLKQVFAGKVWLEILLCRGYNDSRDHLDRLRNEIHRIHPDAVQLHTVFRPSSDPSILPLTPAELHMIADILEIVPQQTATWESAYPDELTDEDIRERVLSVLRRRPCTVRDLSTGFRLPAAKINSILNALLSEHIICSSDKDGLVFFHNVQKLR